MTAAPLSVSADNFNGNQKAITERTLSNLFSTMKSKDNLNILSYWVDARIITNAALSYFDEEVKLYKLDWEPREKVESLLLSYFAKHPIIRVRQDGNLLFQIDDKEEFSVMIRKLADAILWWMSPFLRTIAITIAFWWNSWLESKLSDLDKTVWELKTKEYRNIVFDYLGWIVKRIAQSVNWKMTVKWYYDEVSSYYPNKNSKQIMDEVSVSGQSYYNITKMQYPFKK